MENICLRDLLSNWRGVITPFIEVRFHLNQLDHLNQPETWSALLSLSIHFSFVSSEMNIDMHEPAQLKTWIEINLRSFLRKTNL